MKKIIIGLCIGLTLFFMTGCGKQEKNIEGTLEEIMTKVYAGISEDELPMMLSNVEVTDENIENIGDSYAYNYEIKGKTDNETIYKYNNELYGK